MYMSVIGSWINDLFLVDDFQIQLIYKILSFGYCSRLLSVVIESKVVVPMRVLVGPIWR